MQEDTESIVIDNGSGIIKTGFGGEEAPKSIFSTIIGTPKHEEIIKEKQKKKIYIGEEAQKERGFLSLEYPIENGIVKNWENMEKIWNQIFEKELKIKPEEYSVLINEPPLNPKGNREKMMEIMFEKFNVRKFYVSNSGNLTAISSGKNAAINVEMGDGVFSTVPVFGDYTLTHAIKRINFGGRDLTDYLTRILTENDYYFETSGEKEFVREIKEELCYVALDFEKEMQIANESNDIEKTYDLPDGNSINIGNQRFRCPEVLFNREYFSRTKSITQIIFDSIMDCDSSLRKTFFENIVLSGGNSMFPGMKERIQKEISLLAPQNVNVNVIALPERKFLNWIGGSILVSLDDFKNNWISKKEFDEFGHLIVHKKCF
ncbi:actin-10-related [Anaeramoeba ignava]|uniref:Actin-10-related n=1 Tax=Anaeramoeba ignava TaxID=1746090 RepID=A0A9Q0R6E4_ANAIG|nr:actin-10-related [Anaeramoeba ignava]